MKKIISTLGIIAIVLLAFTTNVSASEQPVYSPQYCYYVVSNIRDMSTEKARPKAEADILSRHPEAIFHGTTVTFIMCGPGIP